MSVTRGLSTVCDLRVSTKSRLPKIRSIDVLANSLPLYLSEFYVSSLFPTTRWIPP